MVASSESKGRQDPFGDPIYKAAVIDILGAVAYGEVSAVERLTDDAKMAPSLEDKTALLAMAAAQQAKIQPVLDRLVELDVDAYAAMEPLREGFDSFHLHTKPADWWESLVKAYVGELANQGWETPTDGGTSATKGPATIQFDSSDPDLVTLTVDVPPSTV